MSALNDLQNALDALDELNKVALQVYADLHAAAAACQTEAGVRVDVTLPLPVGAGYTGWAAEQEREDARARIERLDTARKRAA